MENILKLRINRLSGPVEEIDFSVKRMFNAGWAGSDRAALQHHIDELAELGVTPPTHIPTLFALGNHLLTTSREIQVHGDQTSGEVEYVLLWHNGEILVAPGSDHTDRRLETHSVPKSKNLCLNVMSTEVWPYSEVKVHFDRIRLTCQVTKNGVESLYQDDALSALLGPDYWIKDLEQRLGRLEDGLVLFSGTIGAAEGLVFGERYAFQMTDPVLRRTIDHAYDCQVLTGAIEDY